MSVGRARVPSPLSATKEEKPAVCNLDESSHHDQPISRDPELSLPALGTGRD